MSHLAAWILLLSSMMASPSMAAAPTQSEWWQARLSHQGQQDDVFLRLRTEQGVTSAWLTVPSGNFLDVPIGAATGDPEELVFASIGLKLRKLEDGSLQGTLPHSLVPHYDIEATFKPGHAPSVQPVPSAPEPEVHWTTELGVPVWAGLLSIEGGGIVAVGRDGAVVVIDEGDGSIRWRKALQSPARGTPSASSGLILVATDEALSALDADTGETAWHLAFGPEIKVASSEFHYSSSIAISGPWGAVGSRDGCVYVFQLATGEVRTKSCGSAPIVATPVLTSTHVVVGATAGTVKSVDVVDGRVRWQHVLNGPISRDLLAYDRTVVAGTRSYDLVALDADSGSVVWQSYFWFSWIDSPALLSDGQLLVGSSDAMSLFSLDPRTGKELWRARSPGWVWSGPVARGSSIYFGAVGSSAYPSPRRGALLSVNHDSGAVRWMLPARASPGTAYSGFGAPVTTTSNGRVIAADLSGRVLALSDPGED